MLVSHSACLCVHCWIALLNAIVTLWQLVLAVMITPFGRASHCTLYRKFMFIWSMIFTLFLLLFFFHFFFFVIFSLIFLFLWLNVLGKFLQLAVFSDDCFMSCVTKNELFRGLMDLVTLKTQVKGVNLRCQCSVVIFYFF